MNTIEINDEELEVDDDEESYCPQCNGSGEGMYDGSRCHSCGGSGIEPSGTSREDYEAERADQRNDETKLEGEWK